MATVELFRMIVQHTDSPNDQGHARILIDNNTKIPDRTACVLKGSRAPIHEIKRSADGLIRLGADFLLIPCNTSHLFFDEIQSLISVEIVNMIAETALETKRQGIRTVGLLATAVTTAGGVYQHFLEEQGIRVICPDPDQQRVVMDFIYSGVKASNDRYNTRAFCDVVQSLMDQGAERIILGCTEIPVGMKMYGLDFPFIDSLEVLAKTAILKAGYRYR